MKLTIEIDREEDGRYFAVVQELPGVITYGNSEDEAVKNAVSLALRVLADKIEHGEPVPIVLSWVFHFPLTRRKSQWRSTKARRVLAQGR